LAFLAYAAIALVANLPAWPGDPARIATCNCGGFKDPVQTAWFLAWTPYALLHGHNVFLTNWVNAPSGVNLAQNTSISLLALLATPITEFVSPVAAENALRFLAFPLSAIAMFCVVQSWVRYVPAAFAAGLLYGFSPYVVGQASVHLDLSFVPLPPIICFLLARILFQRPERPFASGVLLGFVLVAQFAIDAEILATTALAVGVAGVIAACARPRALPVRLFEGLPSVLIACGVAGLCLGYPVYLLLHGPQRYIGPAEGVRRVYNADLLGSVLPTSAQLFAPGKLGAIGSSLVAGRANVDENGSYLGIPLLCTLGWLALRYRSRPMLLALATAFVMGILSLGPRLNVDRHEVALPFMLPFRALGRIGLLEDVLPARLALYEMVFASFALGFGIAASHEHWTTSTSHRPHAALVRRRRTGTLLSGAVTVVTVLSLLPRWPYSSKPVALAPGLQSSALASIAPGATVITYPYTTPADDQPMLWQALDMMRFKLLGSYMLRRQPGGGATQLPSGLAPYDVVGLLADAPARSAVAIPKVAFDGPTVATVRAKVVVLDRAASRSTSPRSNTAPSGTVATPAHDAAPRSRPAVEGIVWSTNRRTRSFFVEPRPGVLVQVLDRRTTRYLPQTSSPRPFDAIKVGMRVVVYGDRSGGSITKAHVNDLRRFLVTHHVDDAIIDRSVIGAAQVEQWFFDALGPPQHNSGGAAIWLDVPGDLTHDLRHEQRG